MNQEQFDQAIKFFERHTECSEYQALKLASYADSIICMTKCGSSKNAVETVLYGIRNAYLDGDSGYY